MRVRSALEALEKCLRVGALYLVIAHSINKFSRFQPFFFAVYLCCSERFARALGVSMLNQLLFANLQESTASPHWSVPDAPGTATGVRQLLMKTLLFASEAHWKTLNEVSRPSKTKVNTRRKSFSIGSAPRKANLWIFCPVFAQSKPLVFSFSTQGPNR